ncbi:MAG: glycosyltransferase family 2 protein [Anaerolineae bacterium]|nr:glycosyltransferase family 2 protein [Anaerolineae bacterium]
MAILIPTYNRAAIVRRTVQLLREHLHYSGHVNIIVGCDGSDDTPDALQRLSDPDLRVLTSPSSGLGANVNRLMRACGCDFMLSMDDDHHLIAPLSLDRHVAKLMRDESAGWIHLLMEARGDEHFDSYKFTATLDGSHYWRVDWNSPEHFIMSFRPHLFHRRWLEVYGWVPEGLKTGQTEYLYAQACKARGQQGSAPAVLVPLSAYGFDHWAHVGESWNKRGL